MSKFKLYHLTSSTYELPLYVDSDRTVVVMPAGDIPLLCWPNGQWCLPANIYMLELFKRGLSRKNRGGTLLTYAANISHLIRYCFNPPIDFHELTDNQFTLFIKSLQGERRATQPEVFARDANSVIAIGRNCLDFLASVGRLYLEDDLVGPNGKIRAVQKEFQIRPEGRRPNARSVVRKYWHHNSFPTRDPQKRRLPISSNSIKKMREAIHTSSVSIFQRKRRYVMMKVLEITGGRRSEVSALTVDSVLKASAMSEPMLKLLTAKRPGGREEYRYLPISKHDVVFLLEFIEMNRRRTVRATCGVENDDGYVLISETTGKQLRPNTITQEIATLAKAAGITEQSCPHMFRHRFITKLFVALIEQHEIDNVDEFRRVLLDSEKFKQKIQQWTGHTNLSSLEVYIHLAFDEVANFNKTFNVVSVRRAVESFKDSLVQFKQEISDEAQRADALHHMLKLIEAFDADLERLGTDNM